MAGEFSFPREFVMPDAAFDAVICGGGAKSLFLAMYLVKYGGMSVGIFERRHEIGGGLATEEISAPGFRGNTHACIILPWYYAPVWRDFPEFWDYGAQWDQYLCTEGAVFANNETCLAIYSEKHDPTQERTAKEIARFSEKDAELWLKLWQTWQSDETQRVTMDSIFNPVEFKTAPEFGQRQMAVYPKLLEAGIAPDSLTMAASPMRAAQELWESEEVQYCLLRFAVSAASDISEPGSGGASGLMGGTLPTLGLARGGTHQIAHAAHQILVQSGCKLFTHSEVEKVLIENGTATGIRLTDGTEIGARKLVVSAGLNPRQLCFDLIGRDYLDEKLARRIELLSATNIANLMWYSLALHEAPKYKAAAFNPDINETFWLALSTDANPEHIASECRYSKLNMFPPLDDFSPVVLCNSLVDPAYAPPGKHVAQHEMQGPPATAHTEKEWLEIKKQHAEDLITVWGKVAPNMTWDNIIGVDSNSPYDCLRMKNLRPTGNAGGLDRSAWQIGNNRPTPELANHRTPIKNLYATGGCWNAGSNASASESYSCYKIIATDMGLGKPWEEQGKEEPDSLVQQTRTILKRVQALVKPEDK